MTGIYRGWAQFLTKVLPNFLNKQKYAMYTATANMEAAAVANISNNVPFHGCRQVKTVTILYYGTLVFRKWSLWSINYKFHKFYIHNIN